jgi:hypothetical protein
MFVEERIFLIGAVRAMDRGVISGLRDPLESGRFPFLQRPQLFRDACFCLDLAEEAIRRSDVTPEEALAFGADFRARFQGDPRTDMVAGYGRFYALVFTKFGEHVASLRLARVVMALLEHRQKEAHWPETLSGLGDMPTDPFSGKPFLYERSERGCTVRAAKDMKPEELEDRNLLWTLDDAQIPAMPR